MGKSTAQIFRLLHTGLHLVKNTISHQCLHLKHNGEIKENSDANCSLNPQIMREKPRETGGKFYPFAAKINLNLKKWWIHTYRLYYYENTSLKYTITTLKSHLLQVSNNQIVNASSINK